MPAGLIIHEDEGNELSEATKWVNKIIETTKKTYANYVSTWKENLETGFASFKDITAFDWTFYKYPLKVCMRAYQLRDTRSH